MAEFIDPPITGILAAFQQCLCEQIEADDLPTPCFCGVLAGANPGYDYGDEGMAWVRLVQAGPSRQFPTLDDSYAPCAAPLAYQIEMGILRCSLPFSDSRGNPPTVEQQFNVARLQMADMIAMKNAIMCCQTGDLTVALNTYGPLGPEGGLVGGAWSFSVSI